MIETHSCSEACYRCNATAWEWVETRTPYRKRPEDVIACLFCGALMAVPAEVRKQETAGKIQHDEFRFQFGRFRGLTFAEADAEPNGRKYLELMRDSNERLRQRISEYLAHAAPSAEAADGIAAVAAKP